MNPLSPAPRPETRHDRPVSKPWSMQIGRVAGIAIYLHFTFLFLLVFLGLGSTSNLLFVIALFACVALHELGHALVAVRYGIPVADITLYPMGGIARIEKQPEPKQELWIAVAGPMVNVIIAFLLGVYLTATGQVSATSAALTEGSGWAVKVMGANVALALFNLIPAFPMDGGRIFRALLAMRMPLERATAVAATVGQFLAIVGGLAGIISGQWFLVLIAFIIYVGAGQEVMVVRRESLVKDVSVKEAMLSDVHTLSHGATYRQAADLLLATSQQDFPIVMGDEVYGLLTRDALMRGLAAEGGEAYIASGMDREFTRTHPDNDLQGLLQRMQDGAGPALVFDGDRMVGMVTKENLMEFMLIRQITSKRVEVPTG